MMFRERTTLTICRCRAVFFYEKLSAQTSDSLWVREETLGSVYEE
jgi:hypothetical protein